MKFIEGLTRDRINNAYTYSQYQHLFEMLVDEGRTTGDNQSEALVNYTKLNLHRTKRVEKHTKIEPEVIDKIKSVHEKYIFLVITEPWCGDAAQNIPVIQKLAELNDNISLKFLLRDEHLDVMDQFLTYGGRSVPKVIVLKEDTLEVVADWGPRPGPAMEILKEYKSNPEISKEEFTNRVQKWYAKDKGKTIQQEFVDFVTRL